MSLRLVFCCGLMELFTCSLLTKILQDPSDQTVLVLYGRAISMPQQHISDTRLYAHLFGDWDQIIDLTALSDSISLATDEQERLGYLQEYASLFKSADQVLMHTLWKQPEWSFLDLCPQAEIILYDNGLDSHLPRKCIDHTTRETIKKGQLSIRKLDLERVHTAFYTLGDMLPVPDFSKDQTVIIPNDRQIRGQLETIGKKGIFEQLSSIIPPQDRPLILLAGTSFSRGSRITSHEEEQVYQNYISSSLARGTAVIFKEHPRSSSYQNTTPVDNVTRFNCSLPIEFLPCVAQIAGTASISSSTLLLLKKVFSLEYTLIGKQLHNKLELPWIDNLKKYASEYHD